MSKISSRSFVPNLMVSASFLVLASPAMAASPSLTELMPLTAGQYTEAYGISGDASIVVGRSSENNGSAVYWGRDGVAHDMGIAPGAGSRAMAISADGAFATGTTSIGGSNVDSWGYQFVGGTNTVLPKTLFGGSTTGATANGISSDGSVIVGWETDDTDTFGVVWSGANWATETGIGTLSGSGSSSYARAVSGDGTIVVGDSTDGSTTSPIYWTSGGGMHALDVPGGSTLGMALAISTDGSTIVGYATVGADYTALAWTGANYATQTDLGTLGGTFSMAWGVSADGSVIVGDSVTGEFLSRAFRYANGTMSNLNTLLSDAGVDMTGIDLEKAAAVSADGKYIAAQTQIHAYLVYYDGITGGVSTSSAQQDSVDELGETRQSLGVQQDAFISMLIGDLSPNNQETKFGAFGLYGSAAGGIAGQVKVADNLVLSGGILGGRGDYNALDYKGVMASMALRYDFADIATGVHPFAQVGGAIAQLSDLTFKRTYANGAGTATGVGSTSGHSYSVFGRGGIVSTLSENDQLVLAAEIGERWLSTDAYAESTIGNPFPAFVESGTDRQTVAKLSAALTHNFTPKLDVTLRAAVGDVVEGTSGLRVAVAGFGTAQSSIEHKPWLEGGVRIGWKATDTMTLNVYATGISGNTVKTSGHVGLGAQFSF